MRSTNRAATGPPNAMTTTIAMVVTRALWRHTLLHPIPTTQHATECCPDRPRPRRLIRYLVAWTNTSGSAGDARRSVAAHGHPDCRPTTASLFTQAVSCNITSTESFMRHVSTVTFGHFRASFSFVTIVPRYFSSPLEQGFAKAWQGIGAFLTPTNLSFLTVCGLGVPLAEVAIIAGGELYGGESYRSGRQAWGLAGDSGWGDYATGGG